MCAAYRQQLLSAFLCSYVPVEMITSPDDRSWLLFLPELPKPTVALETSMLAVSTAKLGRMYGHPALVRESLKFYSQGLVELQKALYNPYLMYKDETLAACMALAMYEILECPGATKFGYVSHQNGCERLVQLRGAQAHSSGLGHQLFRTFRMMGVSGPRRFEDPRERQLTGESPGPPRNREASNLLPRPPGLEHRALAHAPETRLGPSPRPPDSGASPLCRW